MSWSNLGDGHTLISIVLALSSAFVTAAYLVCMSRVMKRNRDSSSLSTLAYSHLLGGAALIPFLWDSGETVMPDSAGFILLLILTIGLLVISRMLYFYAYANTAITNITVFSSLTPLYAMVTGYLFLHEALHWNQLAGLMVICASLYVYFLPAFPRVQKPTSWFAPFTHVVSSKPVFCAFLSTIPTAFAAVTQKQLLMEYVNPVTFSFWLLFGIGAVTLAIYMLWRKTFFIKSYPRFPASFYVASCIFLPLMHVLFSTLILYQPAAVALVLQRTSIVFQVLLAYFILHETGQLAQRLVIIGFIFVGFCLIML